MVDYYCAGRIWAHIRILKIVNSSSDSAQKNKNILLFSLFMHEQERFHVSKSPSITKL